MAFTTKMTKAIHNYPKSKVRELAILLITKYDFYNRT